MDLAHTTKKLGFGLMRLPHIGEAIDVEQTAKMVDLFLAAGFTYFDTAWAYYGSEDAIRKALVERYPREAYTLATKNAAWIACKTKEDAIAQFTTSLARTGAGYFDYYLLHNLGTPRTQFFDRFGLWDYFLSKKEEGLIKHLGFSFHSTPEELEKILQDHPQMEFVQLQINYADWDNPQVQSRANYEMARKYGKNVVIMEPVKGGLLANPPEPVKAVFLAADPHASFASWALRFAASLPGVIAVLSGMSTLAQMEDNISLMKDFVTMSPAEKATLEKARDALKSIPLIPCTSCNYCAKVCPNHIGISASFSAYNNCTLYHNKADSLSSLKWHLAQGGNKAATACAKCGACEKVCPQHISIREELAKVDQLFSAK